MKKTLLLVFALAVSNGYSQADRFWSSSKKNNIEVSKSAKRDNFPKEFKLYDLNLQQIKQTLFSVNGKSGSVIITLPNAEGQIERFQMFEASNFDAELQAQFPEIRAYKGYGLDDKLAQLRISIAPEGIQTMVFRTDKKNEFIERYSADGTTYAVFTSSRNRGEIPFTCSTDDKEIFSNVSKTAQTLKSSSGKLLTFRLAMSCTGEYAAYHGGTVPLVMTAFNNTMTRVNGVFEKDLAIHMNMIANTSNVIYLNANSDPYGPTDANYNSQLQSTLTSVIGDANYDVGHLVSAIGNNGNAGCIGCVCDSGKGSGYTTSTAPIGDNFDIDFVAHELGHQFGGTHSFSNSNEGSGTNVEVGSGVTVMGYAGITPYDTHLHSIDVFHASNISQIQANMESKTCPTVTNLTHGAPVVNAGADYTIPKSTPFILTGSATDSNSDPLNYVWEQNDDGAGQTGANSGARINKPSGPNWVNYIPSTTPSRYFPKLSSVIANQATTAGLDVTAEALSSVARTLNFRLTARDNNVLGGQTGFDDMTVTVNATAGPFLVTAPNTNVSWAVGSNQTVTWDVAGTTANNVNTAFVDIYLSTNGGNTYPILLAHKVPNDGSETITIPNNVGTTNRIMIKGNNHIFFDISNTNFAITSPASTFGIAFNGQVDGQNKSVCQGANAVFTIPYATYGGFSGTTTFNVTGIPAGATATFAPTSISSNGNVTLTISNTNAAPVALYSMTVTATSGAITKTAPLYLDLVNSNFGTQNLTSPANAATAQSTTTVLTWAVNAAATQYDVQVATDAGFSTLIANTTVATNSYAVSGLSEGTTYYWRVRPKNTGCSGTFSTAFTFLTGQSNCTLSYSNNLSLNVPDGIAANSPGAEVSKTIVVPGTVTGTLNDVNVTLSFNHAYIDDLVVWMSHPDGTNVYLWNRNCENEFSSVNVTFDDGNPFISASSCAASTGTFSPNTPLSVLNGKVAAGTWTLRARDYWNGDTGAINNWSINLCVAENLSTNNFGISDLKLYPNPNQGTFNVQFDSKSGNDIKIDVYDMRGRLVFENSYKNSGIFNQTIQLNNVQSGIYLVNIQDGDQREVKKISVK
ncbi:reprolysin-like metallopeptidase [Flavobacterium enshiense]|uniref:zinc-dependent metalloprotease n=1 Tax=Flavobacterium enshiense TaxID=1341165 RepID=UPI00345CE59D